MAEKKFKLRTKVEMVSIERLLPAEWNYKKDGTDEQYEKLINSIMKDESLGVMAVRKLKGTTLEVMDGNHRLEAAKRMGLEKVPVENFGDISIGMAVTVARRRNHTWFEDDKLKLMDIMNEYVFDEFDVSELEEFMPETAEELEAYKVIDDLDWSDVETKETGDPTEPYKSVKVSISEETFNLWQKWKKRLKDNCGVQEEAKAFEYAVIEAMNIPEEKLSHVSS